MIPDSLRRTCVFFLAICCLGLELRHSPPDIFFPAEARISGSEQHEVEAVIRDTVARAQVLIRQEQSAGEKSFGSAVALSAGSMILPTPNFLLANARVPLEGCFAGVTFCPQARAPPLPA